VKFLHGLNRNPRLALLAAVILGLYALTIIVNLPGSGKSEHARPASATVNIQTAIKNIEVPKQKTVSLVGRECFPVLANAFDKLSMQAYAKYANLAGSDICIIDAKHNIHILDGNTAPRINIAGYTPSDYKMYLAMKQLVDLHSTDYGIPTPVQAIALSNVLVIGSDGHSFYQPFLVGGNYPRHMKPTGLAADKVMLNS
jgi:hypothetical protein